MKKCMKRVLVIVLLLVAVGGYIRKITKVLSEKSRKIKELNVYYKVVVAWLDAAFQERFVSDWLEEKKYSTVAIYGRGTLGLLLYEELKKNNVKVSCFIDQSAEEFPMLCDGVPVIPLSGFSAYEQETDVIIVTPIHATEAICNDLQQRGVNVPEWNLDCIINEM
jgi:FlaA1/EpsC-like NDP-sugar epimerase